MRAHSNIVDEDYGPIVVNRSKSVEFDNKTYWNAMKSGRTDVVKGTKLKTYYL